MNIHDEVMAPCIPEASVAIKETVDSYVESLRSKIPLAGMDWSTRMGSWAEK
jgi:hypothetical protein